MNFSILQAVYKNDSPKFLDKCFDSINESIIKPQEIILVKDGELNSDLEDVISKWTQIINIKVVGYAENMGLAHALNYGIQFITTDLVARMDSDDYCCPKRFDAQLKYFKENEDVEICGTAITEFYESEYKENKRIRKYPEKVDKQSLCLFKGTPLAHPTLMIKTKLLKDMLYNEDTAMNEDIDLWFRLLKENHVIHNIEEPLLNFRITDGTFKRRSFRKAINEYKIYKTNLYDLFGFSWRLIYPFLRLCSRLLPSKIIKYLYFSKLRLRILTRGN